MAAVLIPEATDDTSTAPRGVREKFLLTLRTPRRGRGFWYGLAIDVLWPFVMIFTRSGWHGGRHIPAEGPVLIASNHVSFADPVTVTAYVLAHGRIPRYLAKAGLWKVPVVRSVLAGGRHIPVHRGTSKATDAYRDAVKAVEAGECVLVFPEGTFTADPDGWPSVKQAKSGIARLALATGAPVVPIGHWGTQFVLPPKGRFPRLLPRRRVVICTGEPVDLADLLGQEPTREVVEEATRRIVKGIVEQVERARGEKAPRGV
ncbi:lysophospholipid acyltransferase family protein [Kutzneria kofuensis]|uniref:1-acyl-sn-glycerol-3-phosphate acyltransferase n=1 Tax=Kutzneria kofuensis TaxID=103725 RepID=A0A7W9KL82_9PSEU|nr:lysophospholipid acyltransferase family protein [Kutzneria kofuensis]MBB5894628.1 1-acyl-sn-glycerol-3-phosphate acyltransferase [Kutzneria kofuensis]